MNNTLLDTVAAFSKDLMKFGFSVEEFATLVQENNMTDAEVLAVAKVFEHLKAKKDSSTVDFLLRTSRLPLKVPKTFDNFDFSRITGKNIDKLRNLSTLSALYAHKNLAFIGKPGTGKTHLAQAFGRACCEHGMKAYFIKMTELRDRMTDARRAGRESTLLAALVRPSCLIIDEVGHCEFDKESTRLFFDMVDRRYQKDGYLCDTHTAVAFHVAAQKKRDGVPMVVLSTASPFKFPRSVLEALGHTAPETVSLRSSAASPAAAPSQKSGI